MVYSDDFIRQVRKKSASGRIAVSVARKLFLNFLEAPPEDLRWDIFNLFFPGTEDQVLIQTDSAERLSIVIDLFEGEYDENNLELSDDELKYISEGVNDYALEMTDDVLMNVMKAAVARGLLG